MTSDFEMAPCEPSAVLQTQMSEGARWNADTSGPRALMLAVLEDAVRCIEEGHWRSHSRARRLAAEAEAWVRCERQEWPFSFVNICEVLGFDVDAMRAHLLTSPRDAAHRRRTRLRAHGRSPMRSRTVTMPPQRDRYRFAVTREFNDRLVAPRFAPSQRAYHAKWKEDSATSKIPTTVWKVGATSDQPHNRPGRTGQSRTIKRRFV